MYRVHKTRKRITPRFFISLSIFLCVILAVVLFFVLRPSHDALIAYGSVLFTAETRAAVVRDEACYSAENKYDRAVFYIPEGALVDAGTCLMQTYRWGYTDDIMQSLLNSQANVLEMQMTLLEGILDTPELDVINDTIEELLAQSAQILAGDKSLPKTLLEIENELKQAFLARDVLLRDKTYAPEELVQLYNAETRASDTLYEWANDILAAESGTVSFYSDGFEQSLNVDKLDLITATLIKNAQKSTGFAFSNNFMYKIVKEGRWYIAFLTPESSSNRVVPGENYIVSFKGYETTPYTAKAASANTSDGCIINLLEFNQPIGDFRSIRAPEITIRQEFTGLKVESSAIDVNGDVPEITIVKNGKNAKVAVDVLANDGKYAVVRARPGNEALFEGQKYIVN